MAGSVPYSISPSRIHRLPAASTWRLDLCEVRLTLADCPCSLGTQPQHPQCTNPPPRTCSLPCQAFVSQLRGAGIMSPLRPSHQRRGRHLLHLRLLWHMPFAVSASFLCNYRRQPPCIARATPSLSRCIEKKATEVANLGHILPPLEADFIESWHCPRCAAPSHVPFLPPLFLALHVSDLLSLSHGTGAGLASKRVGTSS